MKKISFWSFVMPVMMMFAAFTLSSCGDDDEPTILDPDETVVVDPYEVAGTVWEETHLYSDGSETTLRVSFQATSNSCTFQQIVSYDGSSMTTTSDYTYRRSKNLVVMSPEKAGQATLEATIDESGIKMVLRNTSKNTTISDKLYKR